MATCGALAAGPAADFRHVSSKLVIEAGDAHHRGIDLVAGLATDPQVIEGEASYGMIDKALEDEDVDVFACRDGAWQSIGTARTNGEGHFSLALTGANRLPAGMRDLAMSVRGDRTSTRFLAIVADAQLAVTDVDGTLTASELAFAGEVFDQDPAIQDGAAAAWQAIAAKGMVPVYLTARPRMFTDDTRAWLARHGMPPGALRLASGVLLPGTAQADFKADALQALDLPIAFGVGNRASDVDAYTRAGVDPIYLKLPEFESEVAGSIAAGDAVGFETYAELQP